MARNLFFTASEQMVEGPDGQDVPGYVLGSRELLKSQVHVVASSGGTDLILVNVKKADFEAAQGLGSFIGGSYLEVLVKALAHEAHIKDNDPGNYQGKFYTIAKNLKDCLVWDDGVDGEGNPVTKTGSLVQWYNAGMPQILRFRRPVEYFTGDRGKVM